MNRNTDMFSMLPSVNIGRSTFDRKADVKLTGNVGDLIPFYVEEILPGDTYKVKTAKVIRLQTPAVPVMDNLYADFYYFFVPNRLVWEHWRNLMGENTESAWVPSTEYSVPQLVVPGSGVLPCSIADYMGLPPGVGGYTVNALPFRAYALICNEWFRDQNLSDPIPVSVGDANDNYLDIANASDNNYIKQFGVGGRPYKAAKMHDYFTSALPQAQKGTAVPISSITAGKLPVFATDQIHDSIPKSTGGTNIPLVLRNFSNTKNQYGTIYAGNSGATGSISMESSAGTPQTALDNSSGVKMSPVNLWASLDTGLSLGTVNELRKAFQIQRLLEKDARGGTRYIEQLKVHFGVTSPDARMQRPEYLGGNRIPITISQVLANTADAQAQKIGSTGAVSLTVDNHFDFTHSFTEHGFLIGIMCLRYRHTYQQGIERFWSRKQRFDYYFPVLANIGEQPILNKEIYLSGTEKDNEVFGYQEAWADYRYKPARVAGEMRSSYAQSLDVWHFADDYDSQPYLSDEWIKEDSANIDRALTVASSVSNQFFADILTDAIAVRPMPLYSVPGLMDHN